MGSPRKPQSLHSEGAASKAAPYPAGCRGQKRLGGKGKEAPFKGVDKNWLWGAGEFCCHVQEAPLSLPLCKGQLVGADLAGKPLKQEGTYKS